MYDIKWIRENPDLFDRALTRRGLEPISTSVLELDKEYRSMQTSLQEMQAKRNELSSSIGTVKKAGGDINPIMAEVAEIKKEMAEKEEKVRIMGENINKILSSLPNIPSDRCPDGPDETANEEVRRVGTPRDFDFKPLEHFEIGEKLGLMDSDQAAVMSGARFTILKGALARLERAIGQFMIDTHTTQNGYTEMEVPLLVKDNAAFGTGNLPKFEEDLFKTTNGYYLIPTAEVSLTNSVAGKILEEDQLPIRVTALTPCFRSEAGSAGRDTRGMIRQHQFYKDELVSIVKPEESFNELERMTGCAEGILQKLGLPYRVVCLSTGDMGFCSMQTYDLEVWLPGQGRYREISSCSNCGPFQARRMNARFRPKGQKGTEYVHTLNGSGLAVGRTLIAVMENYQQKDGTIVVPEALRPYMGGLEVITAAEKRF